MTQRVTQDDIIDILQAFGQSGFAQLELSLGSVRIAVNRASAAAEPSVDSRPGTAQIVSPILGMFQAGLEPGAPAFVQPGTKIEPDTTVGIIRVMQNLTVVKAGLRGTVVDVPAQDGQLVEFGQTLMRVSTESAAQGSDSPESDRANAP